MAKILKVDLETGAFKTTEVSEAEEEKYIGGMGFAAALFIQNVDPEVNPYDAENLLIISVGPFCGTTVPFCGRHFVMGKSPLTGILGEASSGGFFGKELKSAGFDYVIIKGKSEEPVYLWIHDDSISLHPARDLWGKGTKETEGILKKTLGDDKIKVASIGPAGENLVRYAAIINELNHAAGRCGLGAVMGDKKLKAIAIRGTGKASVHDDAALANAVKKLRTLTKESLYAGIMSDSGTPIHIDSMAAVGDIIIKNWTLARWRPMTKLGAMAIQARGEIKKHPCFNCPVACKQQLKYEGKWVERPEYETLAMLGMNLLVDDLESLIKWNLLVNDLGIDSISLGGNLAAFLEAADRKLLDLDFNALGFFMDLETQEFQFWGGKEGIENLIQLIANRKGIGNDLAEGVRRFCELKELPAELSIHGKGLEVPAHEPRASNLTALDYATTPRGAYHSYEPALVSYNINWKKELGIMHVVDRYGVDEAVEVVKNLQDASEAYSACGGCIFGFWSIQEITPWIDALNAITGRSYSLETWMQAGERIFNLKRAYNMDCGITKADDALSSRFFTPFKKGGCRGRTPPLDELLMKYYKLRGWDANGRPPA